MQGQTHKALLICAICVAIFLFFPSLAQTENSFPGKSNARKPEKANSASIQTLLVREQPPDTEEDKAAHRDSIEREKANVGYNKRVSEAGERRAGLENLNSVLSGFSA